MTTSYFDVVLTAAVLIVAGVLVPVLVRAVQTVWPLPEPTPAPEPDDDEAAAAAEEMRQMLAAIANAEITRILREHGRAER
ncbi:hypothetical protein [Streptomyces sp. SBT349]|uniref:hypothetical protein n=1 Tax=Streptomyces sp. SBT349 TaxID=1580539 RepID=UPI00066E7A4B|nr:hypothetical protein [Streptomyces sp. SBT349]